MCWSISCYKLKNIIPQIVQKNYGSNKMSSSVIPKLSPEQTQKVIVENKILGKLADIFENDSRTGEFCKKFCFHVSFPCKRLPADILKMTDYFDRFKFDEGYNYFFTLFYAKTTKENKTLGTILEVLKKLDWESARDEILATDWNLFGAELLRGTDDFDSSCVEELDFPNKANPAESFYQFKASELHPQSADEMMDAPVQNYWDGIPLRIFVTRATQPVPMSDSVHKMTSNPRGIALIINITFTGTENARLGCDIDEGYMGNLFCQLGFDTWVARNVPSTGFASLMDRYRKMLKSSMDASVIIVMSHGERDKIYMEDNRKIDIDAKLLREMANDKLERLGSGFVEKPKIFIFQACQEIDDKEYMDKPGHARYNDIRMLHSTCPGNPAMRSERQGSRYIWALVNVFMRHAHEFDIDHLVKLVAKKMEDLNNSRPEGRLEQTTQNKAIGYPKTLYFNPGI